LAVSLNIDNLRSPIVYCSDGQIYNYYEMRQFQDWMVQDGTVSSQSASS